VAVTTSLVNAVHDFEVNARGTLNLLEAIRAQDEPPPLVFTSTNKVYGGLPDVEHALAATATSPTTAAPRPRHRRGAAARLPQPLRLLEGARPTST
jgi:CDP-paratose 2-epimerase